MTLEVGGSPVGDLIFVKNHQQAPKAQSRGRENQRRLTYDFFGAMKSAPEGSR